MEVPFSRRVVVVRAFYSRSAYTGRIVTVLRLPAAWEWTDERFAELWSRNEPLRFELDEQGCLVILSPHGWATSRRILRVAAQVAKWAQAAGGEVAGPNAEIRVGGAGRRLPSVAWLSPQRAALRDPNDEGPLPFCPDFVVEMIAPADRRPQQEAKMQIWMANGVRLAWLIDPFGAVADIYRADGSHEQLPRPATLSGEDILPGLVVDLSEIWRAAGA